MKRLVSLKRLKGSFKNAREATSRAVGLRTPTKKPRNTVAVVVVWYCCVDQSWKFLVQRRSYQLNHRLCFPSGHIRIGMLPLEAAIREVFEETGISLKDVLVTPAPSMLPPQARNALPWQEDGPRDTPTLATPTWQEAVGCVARDPPAEAYYSLKTLPAPRGGLRGGPRRPARRPMVFQVPTVRTNALGALHFDFVAVYPPDEPPQVPGPQKDHKWEVEDNWGSLGGHEWMTEQAVAHLYRNNKMWDIAAGTFQIAMREVALLTLPAHMMSDHVQCIV